MTRFKPKDHIFKAAGAAAGIILGLGLFGLLFGLTGGALADQLTAGLRQKRRLKHFLENPRRLHAEDSPPAVDTAAAAAAWFLCFDDRTRVELLSALIGIYLPEAPGHCVEIISDTRNAGKPIDFQGAAEYFGGHAARMKKLALVKLIYACGLDTAAARALGEDPGGEAAAILEAAGIAEPFRAPGVFGASPDTAAADRAILGISPGVGMDEIKRVYHKLAAQFHPDGGRHLSAKQKEITEEAFIKIKDAYERLINS
jgi:hypothetical protein